MIYPHSREKEAGLLEKLSGLAGSPPAAAAPPVVAPVSPSAPPSAPPPAPPPPAPADIPDVDFSGVDFATDAAAWRQFCNLARTKGLKVPTIYPHSPAREASLTEELAAMAGGAPAAAPAEPEQIAEAEPAARAEESSEAPAATGAVYTMDDVAKHSKRGDAW